jgi:hypothetical protein
MRGRLAARSVHGDGPSGPGRSRCALGRAPRAVREAGRGMAQSSLARTRRGRRALAPMLAAARIWPPVLDGAQQFRTACAWRPQRRTRTARRCGSAAPSGAHGGPSRARRTRRISAAMAGDSSAARAARAPAACPSSPWCAWFVLLAACGRTSAPSAGTGMIVADDSRGLAFSWSARDIQSGASGPSPRPGVSRPGCVRLFAGFLARR